MIKLFKHQEEGVKFFLENKKACLFYEMGTGKTFIALESLTRLKPGKVLIVAPKRVLEYVWKADKEYDLSAHEVTYLNYEKIARDKNFTKNEWNYIVLDEVHKLKGRTTKTSRKFSVVCKKAEYVLGLTGTPVANNYSDIYNIYKHTDIKEFMMSYDEFVYRYYYTKQLESGSGYKFNILLNPKEYALDELIERIGKHCLIKKLEDCVDLPEKTITTIKVGGMVSDFYKNLRKNIFKTEDYSKTMIKLEAIGKEHQAANGFVYDDWGGVINICENKKLKVLDDMLEDILEETDKVIVVYLYKEDLRRLQSLKYDWTTDPSEFPNKQILFIQYGQSEGLNLQYCNQMIFYTYDYSFLKFDQMCGRIYRNGQKRKSNFIIMISEGTIEEDIWWAIKHKKSVDEFLKKTLGGE